MFERGDMSSDKFDLDRRDANPTAGMSRRDFIRDIGLAAGALGTVGALGMTGCAPAAANSEPANETAGSDGSSAANAIAETAGPDGLIPDTSTDTTYMPRIGEYPTPKMDAPKTTEYECDVLVVGGGLAGLNAAFAAAEAGKKVVLADKGTPGYSGLSAWPSCTAYYDPDLDADRDLWEKAMILSCENFANQTWENIWCDESKATFERLQEWGWISSYDRGADTEYYVDGNMFHDNIKGYFNNISGKDRRQVFMDVLEDNGVTVVDHTMIMDIVEDDGRCVGAVGLHYKSSTILTFTAKSVILCTGNGVIKSTGYPVGADTFDGIWIGYQHGLPVTGFEFEDFHMTTSYAPTNVMVHNAWQYVENIWPTGGTVTPEKMTKKAGVDVRVKTLLSGVEKSDITLNDGGEEGAACSAAVAAGNTDDIRIGKWTSPNPKGDIYGAAIGMNAHLTSGIWCGVDDTEGKTGIEGLYVAGDGTNGCYVGGPNYGCQRGSTSSFVSLQGYHAGQAAAKYADTASAAALPADQVQSISDATLAPFNLEKGYSPDWARNVLYGIMTPGWMVYAKSESVLEAGLTQIRQLRSLVSGKLIAENGHDLRLCAEVEHQMLAMELKMLAGLERKESRGYHYRTDYPFRDDSCLYYITFTKSDGDEPIIGHEDLKEEWKGDLSADYPTRYPGLTTPEDNAMYAKKS